MWAPDALYVSDKDVVTRWELGGARRVVSTGSSPTLAGPWLVTRHRDELELTWLGPGPEHDASAVALGTHAPDAGIVARVSDHAVVTVDAQSVRVVELDRPAPPLPTNRHTATIAVIAFRGDDVIAASMDGRIIAHGVGGPTLIHSTSPQVTFASTLVPGTGELWNNAALVVGTDRVVRSRVTEGIRLDDGTVIVAPPLPRDTQALAVSPDLRTTLVQQGDRVRLLDHGEPIVSLRLPQRFLVRLAVGPAIAIADMSGQAFVVDASGVTPLLKLPAPITALAASPTSPRSRSARIASS